MLTPCPHCDGKLVYAMPRANQSREQVKQDGKLKVMHLTGDSKEGDHLFSVPLSDNPDEMLDHVLPRPRTHSREAINDRNQEDSECPYESRHT